MKVFENATPEEKQKLANLRANQAAALRVNIEAQNAMGTYQAELRKKYNLSPMDRILDSEQEEQYRKEQASVKEQAAKVAAMQAKPQTAKVQPPKKSTAPAPSTGTLKAAPPLAAPAPKPTPKPALPQGAPVPTVAQKSVQKEPVVTKKAVTPQPVLPHPTEQAPKK